MARNRKRKSDKGTFSKDQMKVAVKQVVEYDKKHRDLGDNMKFAPNFGNRQVFTNIQEKELEDFILEFSKMCFGLTMGNLSKMAYETAVKNNLRMPDTWVSKEIAGCFGVAFERTVTPTSILASYKRTGIVPMPTILNTTIGVDLMSATAEGFNSKKESKKLGENTDFINPKEFIGYPKAKLRKENPNKRRIVLSCSLTDTPQKEDPERREKKKKSKKIKKPKLDLDLSTSSSEESELKMSDHESSGGEFYSSLSSPAMDLVLNRDPKLNNFVLVKFAIKRSDAHLFYVGRVLTISENPKEFCVSFLRRSNKMSNSFIYPTVEDESMVMKADIAMILPELVATAKIKRQGRFITFEINFDKNVL
ncbi:hypothetical protein ILUMI_13497 [Ignelater luminosus]|uniref:Uncharacterized protein n=1 Tax=Ignelater luminosus TaxID=2038154 RepID=A0A8K0D0P0_IGNLU|nr:hypothetical protein ILUMI_13497 [Ignelater luminosus]